MMKEYAIYSKESGACMGGIGLCEEDGWTEADAEYVATVQYDFDPDHEYIATREYF